MKTLLLSVERITVSMPHAALFVVQDVKFEMFDMGA